MGDGKKPSAAELRRQKLLNKIQNTKSPLSGKELGKELGVSRQIVVQDIAILRSKGHDILSTAKGYVAKIQSEGCSRVIKVCHTEEQTGDELRTIVDYGGTVVDVIVNHRNYGIVKAPLNIKSRRDIEKFFENLKDSKSVLLSSVTSGYHFHTVLGESEDILDEIEQALKEKGYLAPVLDYETLTVEK